MKGVFVVKEIQIKNFRSLKDTKVQKLAPITVLVGENSAGKSTFLRAFPLLKQSITKRTSGPILWAGDVDDYVDFGSFEETVTNDGSNEICFRFRFDLPAEVVSRRYRMGYSSDSDEGKVGPPINIDYAATICSIKGTEIVSKLDLSIGNFNVQFDLETGSISSDGNIFSAHNPGENILGLQNRNLPFGARVFYSDRDPFGIVLPDLRELWGELKDTIRGTAEKETSSRLVTEAAMEIAEKLLTNREIYEVENKKRPKSVSSEEYIEIYNQLVVTINSGKHVRLAPLVKLYYVYRLFGGIGEYISSYFKQVHYIAPIRASAERYYRLRNLAVDEVDYQGKNLAIFINSLNAKRLRKFQAWTMEQFGFSVGTGKSKGHLSLHIRLRNSDKEINLSDTGFGYSQVLPIITQLWELTTNKRQERWMPYGYENICPLIVAIEQPELHLHPAVQARLAKAFIACIDLAKESGIELQLLLETHSETIINYFGRAIAHGQLEQDSVSVIIFDKQDSEGVTTVRNSHYDESGLLCDWPYGFFDPED